jgi:antitoxin component HigA of HigAB toxin-antitoxin module
MQNNCKALYNSLRLNWLLNPTLDVEPWQVEDYRSLSWDFLLEQLRAHDLRLTKETFLSLAEDYDTPEECADDLVADLDADQKTEDQIFLLIFELWRRLIPNKPALSIFCDELDHHIHLFDEGSYDDQILQDLLANLKEILDENVDEGTDPADAYDTVTQCCANDLSSFLYDYISLQIDEGNGSYASELIDYFYDYIPDVKWFDFLRAKISATLDAQLANDQIHQIVEEWRSDEDLDFNFEMLEFLTQFGDVKLFSHVAKDTIPLLESEEDYQDLLAICVRYFHFLDKEPLEQKIEKLLKTRQSIPLDQPFNRNDPQFVDVIKSLEM